MREIKFKAYHIEAKQMLTWDVLQQILGGYEFTLYFDCKRKLVKDGESVRFPSDFRKSIVVTGNIFANPALRFRQYTGRKDRNGKEIYESDLVVIAGKHSYPFPVEYDERVGGFDFDCELVDELDDLLVVGNLYENPELLKD